MSDFTKVKKRRFSYLKSKALNSGIASSPISSSPDDSWTGDSTIVRPDSYKRFLWTAESVPRRSLTRLKSAISSTDTAISENNDRSISSVDVGDTFEFGIADNSTLTESSECDSSFEYSADSASSETDSEGEKLSSDDANMKDCGEFNIENGNDPLYESANVTKLEAFASILAYSIRFNLSKTCVNGLLQLLQTLLPQPTNLPENKYLFFKNTAKSICEFHLYCPTCDNYLCQLSSESDAAVCDICSESFNIDNLIKEGYYFLYMPLGLQLKMKLEHKNLMKQIETYKLHKQNSNSTYQDVVHGDLYKSIEDLQNPKNFSVQFNVDGIPIYKKGKYDIWPIQVAINELGLLEKKENVMLCALWFGKKKPVMNSYLVPFVKELNNLQSEGIKWRDAQSKKTYISKVYALICTSDAPARCALQNFTQYNGKFGCGFCEEEGVRIQKGKGHCRVYPSADPTTRKRTFETTLEYAQEALDQNISVKGVKGSSILMSLHSLKFIEGFIPDYMHCVLLGVTRQLVNIFISTSGLTCSLNSKDIRSLDARIEMLQLPHEATRKLRSTKDLPFWNASEWRIFLVTSPVLLKDILHRKVYKHWLLFVHGVTLLLGSNVTDEEIKSASICFQEFVSNVSKFYGEEEQTYNIHLLLHLPDAVKSWSPLWSHSCFLFEDFIGKLKILHHGTKAVPLQISSSYMNRTCLSMLLEKQEITNVNVCAFLDKMQEKHSMTKKSL